MKTRNQRTLQLGLLLSCATILQADERRFAYTYEPEVAPKGSLEFEQWVDLRAGRNRDVGQENFAKWQFREELEYGVTDRYSISGYLITSAESFRDPVAGTDESEFEFDGVAMENRYMLLNPAEYWTGLTLYLEPRYSGSEAEIEQKLIFGQRYGDWKWAFNLSHATEWEDNLHEVEGEFEASFGLSRDLNRHWSIGFEFRNHNELPEYEKWENTAFFFGPVVSYRQEKWYATLSILPQVYGRNFDGNPDHARHLDLDGHERLNARLIVGIDL